MFIVYVYKGHTRKKRKKMNGISITSQNFLQIKSFLFLICGFLISTIVLMMFSLTNLNNKPINSHSIQK